ncbi:hypothetical protein [Chondromyces apiculatus]|uniref:Uncharacterized protein n=1 Tax=Chondromyces apiculatus DSM 436 TaxID=1192034 RepID=A0A017T331_9BACT|nr:hypothetical protein [Chondromyces apiculatus]EYF02956.1 Hypothetical protein CAP_6379 [Chondromyces apiculatus DSM 436]
MSHDDSKASQGARPHHLPLVPAEGAVALAADITQPEAQVRVREATVGAPPVVCRKLRTKQAFGSPHPGLLDWRHGHSSTAVYWCLSTMETAGPDDSYAHPHGCRAGRSCYLPPPGAELDDPSSIA